MPQEEWDSLDEEARWAANQKFLDDAIRREDEIVLNDLVFPESPYDPIQARGLSGPARCRANR